MKISLENYLRNKLDEVESVHLFDLATDTIRCWIDEYNEQLSKCNVSALSSQTDVALRYYHPCVGVGLFVKEYVGRYGRGLVVKLDNGREWFAPINEFIRVR